MALTNETHAFRGRMVHTPLEIFTNHFADRPVTMHVHGRSNLDRVEPRGMAPLEGLRAQVDGCQGCSLSFIKPWKNLDRGPGCPAAKVTPMTYRPPVRHARPP